MLIKGVPDIDHTTSALNYLFRQIMAINHVKASFFSRTMKPGTRVISYLWRPTTSLHTLTIIWTSKGGSNTRMTDDVLHTIFCEVENIINSRPLTKASDDVNDESVITPNHFLLLSGNYSVPWVRTTNGDVFQRRWRHVQHVVGHFWARWLK